MHRKQQREPTFIDLFAGCGGLSLGLAQAGWKGFFAVEKTADAFLTFKENFLNGPAEVQFHWPKWLDLQAHSIVDVLKKHESDLLRLRGQIDVVAGGPPCQGFSFAGRRKKLDPRNMLFEKYVQFVDCVRPQALILENVPGMKVAHGANARGKKILPGPVPKSYYEKLIETLDGIGYVAEGILIDASQFGVPQKRPRLIVIGTQKAIANQMEGGVSGFFNYIDVERIRQLETFGLSERVSASDAISDLAIGDKPLVPYVDPFSRGGFFMPAYEGPSTNYQRLMHEGLESHLIDSTRLANHSDAVLARFKYILKKCRKGVNLGVTDREFLGMLKHRTHPMAPHQPAPTITTLPDDLLHYGEPRILTVRECARIQSFPDWFKFVGKYTTGGHRRKIECPRYTQVGNAVPPLLARAIGLGIKQALAVADAASRATPTRASRYVPRKNASLVA